MSARTLAIGALLSTALLPATAAADDADIEATLAEPILTTASREAETQSLAPATSVVLTADDIRRYGIRTLDEAINFLALGMVTSSTLSRSEVGARGVLIPEDYGNHILMLVNGHAVNEPFAGATYTERGAGILMELVDHIEIILGPGSVLYGSNAMLGVVNVVTKRAKDYSGYHVIAEGALMPSVGPSASLRAPSLDASYTRDLGTTYRLGVGYGKEFQLFGKPGEITLQVEYFAQSGPGYYVGPQAYGNDLVTGAPRIFSNSQVTPPGTWGGDIRDDYYVQAPAGHLRVIVGDWELNVRANTFRRGEPFTGYGDLGNPANRELDRFLSGDLRWERPLSQNLDLRVRVYADGYDYQWSAVEPAAESCLSGQNSGCTGRYVSLSRWAGAEIQLKVDYFNDGRLTTMIGTDARARYIGTTTDYVDAVSHRNPGSVGAFTTNERLLALYAQQEYSPARWLALNAGIRADIEERFSRASPRVAASAKPWPGGTLKLVYAEAFRTPNAYERLTYDPTYQPSAPNLRPETVRSIEASIEQRHGAHRWMFGVFRSWWRDLITLTALTPDQLDAAIARGILQPSTTGAYQNENVAVIDSLGLQANYDGAIGIDQLRYGFNLTAATSRRDPQDGTPATPLPVAPTFFGNARVAYSFGGARPTVGLSTHFVGKRPLESAFDGNFPVAYADPYVATRLTVNGTVPPVAGLSYRASVSYAFPARSAYITGPLLAATPEQPRREQRPVERMQMFLGLEYVF